MICVLNAKSGQGKTFGARSMLECFNVFDSGPPSDHIKGVVITGQDIDDDYNTSLSRMLGATEVEGWMHAFLLALEQPKEGASTGFVDPRHTSIRNSFNSLGNATDDGSHVNVKLTKRLYDLIDGDRNLYALVITQEATVANKLCSMNQGMRIAPYSDNIYRRTNVAAMERHEMESR